MSANEVYQLDPGQQVHCYYCLKSHNMALYSRGEAFLASAGHSPLDGNANFICRKHLDDDAVIDEPVAASPVQGAATLDNVACGDPVKAAIAKWDSMPSAVEVLAKRLTGMGVTNFSFTPGSNPNATPEQVAGEISKALDQIESGTAASATDHGAAVKPWQERMTEAGHDSEPDVFNKLCWELEAKDAEIADWRALAERAQAQPSGAVYLVAVPPNEFYNKGNGWLEVSQEMWARTAPDKRRTLFATPAPEQEAAPTELAEIERRAKAIYEMLPGSEAHPWVERGNSVMQDKARGLAIATRHLPAPTVEQEAAQVVAKADDPSHVMPRFAAPAGQHGAWVGVEDRLPDGEQTVIVLYWPYNNHANAQIVGQAQYMDGLFYTEDGDPHHWPSHWMPLPPPPEQSAASGSREGRDAQDDSTGEGCATATNTNQPEGAKKCWSCKREYTEAQREEADGNCPYCHVEIENSGAANANKGGEAK